MLSGYNSDLYRSEIGDWRRVEVVTQTEKANTRTESLWLNAACVDALPEFAAARQENMSL
jgi:hypothetical protein